MNLLFRIIIFWIMIPGWFVGLNLVNAPLTWMHGRNRQIRINLSVVVNTLFILGFVFPIGEEIIFRQLLPLGLKFLAPDKVMLVTNLLFSLLHFFNADLTGHQVSLYTKFWQGGTAFYLGQQISWLSLEDRIWYHTLYNTIQTSLLLAVMHFSANREKRRRRRVTYLRLPLRSRSEGSVQLWKDYKWAKFYEPIYTEFTRFNDLVTAHLIL